MIGPLSRRDARGHETHAMTVDFAADIAPLAAAVDETRQWERLMATA